MTLRDATAAQKLGWSTVRVTVEAVTPILFAIPSEVLQHEVRGLPMNAPWVVTLPGALHGAIGRELHRQPSSAETCAWFEADNRPAGILLEPPQAPEPMVFGVSLASAGRNLSTARIPSNVLAYDAGEEFTFGVVLVTETRETEADLIRAIVAAGKAGIGGRLLGDRGRFKLVGAVRELEAPEPPHPLGPLRCSFLTPVGGVYGLLDYPTLWKMARTRVLHNVDRHWGNGDLRRSEYDREADRDVEVLGGCAMLEQWLLHFDLFRQDRAPVVECGLVGEAVYSHVPPSHWPILWRAAKLGIGIRTPLGFGRLALEEVLLD